MYTRKPLPKVGAQVFPPGSIGALKPGEGGYITPWNLQVDSERKCWLDPNIQVSDKSSGTAKMCVELQEDGVHVHLTGNEEFSYREMLVLDNLLPVAGLHFEGEESSLLPSAWISHTVASMRIGDLGYITPQSVRFSEEGAPSVRAEEPVHPDGGGSLTVKIERTPLGFSLDDGIAERFVTITR